MKMLKLPQISTNCHLKKSYKFHNSWTLNHLGDCIWEDGGPRWGSATALTSPSCSYSTSWNSSFLRSPITSYHSAFHRYDMLFSHKINPLNQQPFLSNYWKQSFHIFIVFQNSHDKETCAKSLKAKRESRPPPGAFPPQANNLMKIKIKWKIKN